MTQLPFYLLAFVVVLGVLIVVHEFGHYLAARYCGVRAPLAPPRNYVLAQDDADRFSLRIE